MRVFRGVCCIIAPLLVYSIQLFQAIYILILPLYVERIPNRNSNPTWLIRQSQWINGKSRKTTLANITRLPETVRNQIRDLLQGGIVVNDIAEALKKHFTFARRMPHGHVAAALGTLRDLKLDRLIDSKHSRKRSIILALITARILCPRSKLATAQALKEESETSSLGHEWGLSRVHENEIYEAMDGLFTRKETIEKKLARRHLTEGAVVLCDVTSTYVEGYGADLAEFGYNRDGKKGKKQINFGLLCDKEGRPVGVEVFSGSVADPCTLTRQLNKLRDSYGLSRVTIVADRGLLTHARLDGEIKPAGYDGITALRKLAEQDGFQMSIFDEQDMAEITSDDYPGERLMVCRNPLRADHAVCSRKKLLAATEKALDKRVQATRRERRPLRGVDRIALRAGAVLGKYKMKKHFEVTVTATSFSYRRNEASITAEARLDGIYVVRTSLAARELTAEGAVCTYKQLSVVEKAFRSIKTVDLKVRPIYHYKSRRIQCHIFLCMLAYYVKWHMMERLTPMLFVEEDAARAARKSIVAPVMPSPATRKKARTRKAKDGTAVLGFRSLMDHLALLTQDHLEEKVATDKRKSRIRLLAEPTPKQQKALKLLGVSLR